MPRNDQTQPGTPRTGISNRLSPTEEAAERREHPPRSDQEPAGAGGTGAAATPADQESGEEAARDESGE